MHKKEPLIRLAKREDMPKGEIWAIRLSSVVVALLLGCIVLAIAGANPIKAYGIMISGSLGRASGVRQVVKAATPLLGTALALAPCFKMKYWNIGAEGQITMGAVGAAFFAINFAKKWNSPVILIVMAIAAMVFGAVWAGIPAVFKSRWGTNETLFTLMLNYIAIGIVGWLQGGPWEGVKGTQIIPNFHKSAVLPKLFGVHIGWVIALVLVVLMYIYLNKTKQGYEIAVLGESENTARYAGMNVTLVTIRTAMISGAIAGLVGFMLAAGTNQTLHADIAGGVGFTAITVCWLAHLNPFAMIVIAAMLAVLTKGANSLQTAMQVPASISDIITGIILLCMLGCEFFINYKMIFRHHDSGAVTAKVSAAPAEKAAVAAAESAPADKTAPAEKEADK